MTVTEESTPTRAKIEDYAEGDIDTKFVEQVDKNLEKLIGKWEVMKDRSESTEEILKALGIGMIARAAMRAFTPTTQIDFVDDSKKTIKIATFLPMGKVKTAVIPTDGGQYVATDSDTGNWSAWSLYEDGRLCQRRDGPKGVMYDVRCVFDKDPEGKVDSPVQMFRWTLIDPKTKKAIKADRWMRKVVS